MTTAAKKSSATDSSRDSAGRFIKSVISSVSDDTLIDIHVNNPLRKIVALLQDIKAQKAFSFSFKGSIGLLGVIVIAASAGIFGSNKILCDKGIQSLTGTIKILQVSDESSTHPLRNEITSLLGLGKPKAVTTLSKRTLLITSSGTVHLTSGAQISSDLLGVPVVITGKYNSCNQELIISPSGIEPL